MPASFGVVRKTEVAVAPRKGERDGKKTRPKAQRLSCGRGSPRSPTAAELEEARSRSIRLLEGLQADALGPGHVGRFDQAWRPLNAIYEVHQRSTEVDALMTFVHSCIASAEAAAVLEDCEDEGRFLVSLAPGDMRFRNDPLRFRRKAAAYLERYRHAESPEERLANLLAAVYQIRCNLAHGNKDPRPRRARDLLQAGAKIVEAVLQRVH